MIDSVVSAARPYCSEGVVVVGPADGIEAVRVVREDPPGSGPARALARGVLEARDAQWVLALAADAPWSGGALKALLAAAEGDGAIARDAEGRRQPLLAVYRVDTVLGRGEVVPGTSLRDLISGWNLADVPVSEASSRDIDTWEEYRQWAPEDVAPGPGALPLAQAGGSSG